MPCHFVPPVFVCEFLFNCLSFRLSTKKCREYKLINDYYLSLETLDLIIDLNPYYAV
jgi:hypothetical protein